MDLIVVLELREKKLRKFTELYKLLSENKN
jgi:hypothetical protein